jgi:hypothetical protein
MIKLTRIVESYGAEGQLYDLGQDFAAFRRMIDGADQQIRQQYEKQIAAKLVGKRVRARASRGYKQYVKDYEFDVTKITLDDYYDNFVVVAYDSSTPKPKEYFLKSGFKIQILGPATGKPSPQKGGDPRFEKPKQAGPMPIQPKQNQDLAQSQPMALAPATPAASAPALDEDGRNQGEGLYDAYGVEDISNDIKTWLPKLLLKPGTSMRDFVKGLGWVKDLGRGTVVAMYDLRLPGNMMKPNVNQTTIQNLLAQASVSPPPGQSIGTRYEVVKLEPDQQKGEWTLRIKKVMSNEQ